MECGFMGSKYTGIFFIICLFIIIQPAITVDGHIPAQTGSPSSRIHPCMGYDPVNERVIMFGGGTLSGVLGDTWMYEYSTNTWTQIHSVSNPSGRNDGSLVYDPISNCMILYGGWCGMTLGRTDDTWIFNCTTDEWTEVSPEESPSPRSSSNMVYDSTNNVVILFGGYGEDDPHTDDTWCYNTTENTWTEMSPAIHPCGRYGHCMIYDPDNDRTILFSGNSIEGMNPDLWEYNFTADSWTELTAYPRPLGRKWGSMVYDSGGNRGILFGGDCNDPEFIDDTWVLNCSTSEWEELEIDPSPEVRANPGLAYDSINNLIVLFGGQGGGFGGDYYTFDDTWVYADNEWTDMSTMSSSTGTESTGAVSIEWLMVGITVPLIAIAIIVVWKKKA